MSEETKVLSKEEVDALLKVSHDSDIDLTNMASGAPTQGEKWTENNNPINKAALTNITELTVAECEEILTSFLRKKIITKAKSASRATLSECLNGKSEKHVFSVFHLLPNDCYGMAVIDLTLLHHAINLVYGGHIGAKEEPIMETPGKVGIIVAEKLCQLGLEGFKKACGEYGQVDFKIVKTITLPNLTSKMGLDDRVYAIDMSVFMGEIETSLAIIVKEDFLEEFIPVKNSDVKHVESNFWRSAIESQVADSLVSVCVTLPDIQVKVNDLMKFKEGDLIPMSDPTLVYVCLNNLKLFRAKAGQANSKRVAKILSEI